MYAVLQPGPWRHAVGAPLERLVRPHRVDKQRAGGVGGEPRLARTLLAGYRSQLRTCTLGKKVNFTSCILPSACVLAAVLDEGTLLVAENC